VLADHLASHYIYKEPFVMPEEQRIRTIAVFGGSGATGRVLIRHALQRGMGVRTLVRNPAALEGSHEGAEIIAGSLANRDDISSTLTGADAVFCVFGPRPPYTDIFCQQATKTIVEVMKENNIHRLLCQTGGMIGDYPENRSVLFGLMVSLFRKRLPEIWLDRVGQESQVLNSGLSWTIVKPPKLVDKPPANKVVAGTHVRLGLLSSITRNDLANFLLDEAQAASYHQQAVFVRGQGGLRIFDRIKRRKQYFFKQK